MSARLLKKVLAEQEDALAALQHQQQSSDDDSESPNSSAPSRNLFDLLEEDDDNNDDYHAQEKDEIIAKISECDIACENSNMNKVAVGTVSTPNVKSKKKKKKKKNKEDSFLSTKNDVRSNLMLEGSTLGVSSSSRQQTAPFLGELNLIKTDSNDIMLKKLSKSSIIQVDPKHLRAENELRRIFGSKVVNSYERSHVSVNSRMMRGGQRVTHNLKRTILVSPSEHWPRWDGSLSMELLETRDDVHYFRYIRSSSYAQAQRAFEAAKANHDPNGIASILLDHPYHIDSLITLADYFKFTGEHQMSADATVKCLYAMECAWHPLFTPTQNCQLKYVHDTNKPFFSSLFAHMKNMDRRGCHRSALEICKLLLSLDSDDPMGAILCIDYYSLRAEEYAWLERFVEEYRCDNSLWLFPNFSYSLAVCRFYLERSEQLTDTDINVGKVVSLDLMKQALMLHPSVLKKLVVKVPLKDRTWTTILNQSFFESEQTGSPSVDHLISIYVERSYLIWRLPDLQKFLCETALLVIEMLKEQGSDAGDWACVRKEAFSSEKNEYSHLLVSDFSDSTPSMPPDNLQDFVVDQRGVIENHEQFPEAPENHVPRDVSNRNAFAILFESMFPWINLGTAEDEHLQHDPHGQDNED